MSSLASQADADHFHLGEIRTRRGKFLLGPFDVTLPHRGVTALIGPNGAGKTTLLRAVEKSCLARDHSVSFLPQTVIVPARVRLKDFLEYGALLRGIPRTERELSIATTVQRMELSAHLHKRLGQLSGGTMRRALIAEALLESPSVLILDEPSTGLDIEQRSELAHTIMEVARSSSVIISSHVVSDLSPVADHVLVLREGKLICSLSTQDFLCSPHTTDSTVWERAYLQRLNGKDPSC